MDSLAATNAAISDIVLKANALIVNPLIILMFSFALVGFLWGVRGYITHADDIEARAKGAQHIMWGIVGMTIMISTFALVNLMIKTFGFDQDQKTEPAVQSVLK